MSGMVRRWLKCADGRRGAGWLGGRAEGGSGWGAQQVELVKGGDWDSVVDEGASW
jgi:hypothetical protein